MNKQTERESIIAKHGEDRCRIVLNGIERYMGMADLEDALSADQIDALAVRAMRFKKAFTTEFDSGIPIGDRRQLIADYLYGDVTVADRLVALRLTSLELPAN